MPTLQHRRTGSVVNVPEEKVDRLLLSGYERVESKPAKKTAAKRSASTK